MTRPSPASDERDEPADLADCVVDSVRKGDEMAGVDHQLLIAGDSQFLNRAEAVAVDDAGAALYVGAGGRKGSRH